uniref:Uncharacterized protein n=1 Tax=Coccolithus braarudii TaxID=221442 RepID=A0A7S0L2J2_9EUKA|mmetsp:Transcript_11599/g.25241  ORF Transcript_11599/g.25241 Transcript_11599/m.25241 type:complete len:167 (+) Transcript_11599:34-534(+)
MQCAARVPLQLDAWRWQRPATAFAGSIARHAKLHAGGEWHLQGRPLRLPERSAGAGGDERALPVVNMHPGARKRSLRAVALEQARTRVVHVAGMGMSTPFHPKERLSFASPALVDDLTADASDGSKVDLRHPQLLLWWQPRRRHAMTLRCMRATAAEFIYLTQTLT